MIAYNSLTDVELTDLLKSGNHAAFTEIYNRYKALLYIFAYKRIGQREEARDVVHELFLSLWVKHEIQQITTGLLPYLYTSVRNRVMDIVSHQHVASRYIDQFQEYIDAGNSPTDHLVWHKELLLLIEKEIALLKSSINTARIRQLSVTGKKAVTKRSTDATLFQLQLVPDWKISSD